MTTGVAPDRRSPTTRYHVSLPSRSSRPSRMAPPSGGGSLSRLGASVIDPARSFDRAADEYERTRPEYPDAVLELLPLGDDAEVLDLGAGTGKLTRVLARRYHRVVAVEPLDGMRAILARVVPEAEALAGRAEEIPLPDAEVDAVFAGQAFHWFANEDALAEIARVLRPGGLFCLVWNSGDESRPSPLPADY